MEWPAGENHSFKKQLHQWFVPDDDNDDDGSPQIMIMKVKLYIVLA